LLRGNSTMMQSLLKPTQVQAEASSRRLLIRERLKSRFAQGRAGATGASGGDGDVHR
jgi:hypothetical protein